MDYDKLIEQAQKDAKGSHPVVPSWAAIVDKKQLKEYATAIETLRTENEKLRTDLAHVTAERDAAIEKYNTEKEDFLDYVLSGTQNAAPFCRNRHHDCVDKRGWCVSVKCHGFSRDKED